MNTFTTQPNIQYKVLKKAGKLIEAHIEHILTGYNGKPVQEIATDTVLKQAELMASGLN